MVCKDVLPGMVWPPSWANSHRGGQISLQAGNGDERKQEEPHRPNLREYEVDMADLN